MKYATKQIEALYKNVTSSRYACLISTDYEVKRLYHCSAYVLINPKTNEMFLRSYRTRIAYYNPEELTVYNFLNTEYGYTNTSNQHIAKFRRFIREYFGFSFGVILNEIKFVFDDKNVITIKGVKNNG